jgi:transcriptional regulator with PAS, ATPase and Fis domain
MMSQDLLIGESPAMGRVRTSIARAAQSDFNVLIEGESGTGKELVARSIHATGGRRERALISVNCARLPKELIESELFGHEKGAFTGAHELKIGKFEQAHQGTLFLDEMGEMDVSLQAKLLRAIEEGEIERLGGRKPVKVDIRLIAATNRNLKQAVAEGRFREDLYFRLKVLTIRTPPLRDRMEDIPALARHLISSFQNKGSRTVLGITNEAIKILLQYHWPGNVRELRNMIQSAITMGSSEYIEPQDFAELAGFPEELTMQEAIQQVKRQYATKAVVAAKGNQTKAAQILDIHPRSLRRILKDHGRAG